MIKFPLCQQKTFDCVYLDINQSQKMLKVNSGMSEIIHGTLIKLLEMSGVGIRTACLVERMVTSHLNKERADVKKSC